MQALASSSAVLFNEGLDPGVRVTLDDQAECTATVCHAEHDATFCWVRLDSSCERVRVASWRLARIG